MVWNVEKSSIGQYFQLISSFIFISFHRIIVVFMVTLINLWGSFIRNKALCSRLALLDVQTYTNFHLCYIDGAAATINFFFFVLLKSDVHQCFLSQPWQQMNHLVNNRPRYMSVNGNDQLCWSKWYFQSTNPDLLNLHLMFSPQLSEPLSDYSVQQPPDPRPPTPP